MIEPRHYREEVQPAGGNTGAGSVTAVSISLPKGGGAIRGLGEKVTPSPSTGAASLSLAIPASPGRSESGPQLTPSYDRRDGGGCTGRRTR
jgi:Salmonella virulence plasmid 65kDa B protein